MSESCICGGGLGEFGVPNCVSQEKDFVRMIFVPTYDANGYKTIILNTDFVNGILPDTYLQAKLDTIWAITPDQFEEGSPTRSDAITKVSAGGTIKVVSKGVKQYDYQLWNVPTAWQGQMNQGSCLDLSVYPIDSEGKLGGESNADCTGMYPRKIQKNSLLAEDFDAAQGDIRYTKITFQLSKVANESKFYSLPSSSTGSDLLEVKDLVSATIKNDTTTNTTTEIYVRLIGLGNVPVLGYTELTDWGVTDLSEVVSAISAVEEVSDGSYKLTVAVTAGGAIVSLLKVRTSTTAILYSASPLTVVTP
ncbi:MAG: hypothetical protein HRU26_05550 [Psychroserpens sp.]|nr:hypothetical protein [Psychroserpens sp.]